MSYTPLYHAGLHPWHSPFKGGVGGMDEVNLRRKKERPVTSVTCRTEDLPDMVVRKLVWKEELTL
jgi:hypothetical protein